MANGNYAPYPDPIAPSFQSFAERQRMLIDDAIAEREAQEKRVGGVAKAGAKAGFEYDQMLRGYMEAKYANPNLTFWEYSTKPSVGGAFRAEGRKKIAAHISEGGDIKDIPGVSFGERQKAGFRGILGADKRERDARLAEIAKDEPRVQKMAEQELESLNDIGKDVAGVKKTVDGRKPFEAMESLEQLDASKLLSKSPKATEAAEKSLGTIDKLIGGKKPVGVVDPQVSIGEITQAKNLSSGTDVTKLSAEAAAGIEPVAGEAGKGGLKEALGKAVGTAQENIAGYFTSPNEESAAQFGDKFLAWQLRRNKLDVSRKEATRLKDAGFDIGERKTAELAEARIGPPTTKTTAKVTQTQSTSKTNVSMRGGKLYRMGEGGGAQGTYFGDVEVGGMPVFSRPITKGKDVVGSAQIFKFTDPEGVASYYEGATKGTNYNLLRRKGQSRFLTAAGADFDPRAMEHFGMKKLDIDPSIIESAGGPGEYFKSEAFTKAHTVPEIAGEAGKGGLKEALGKAGTVGKGLGYAGSVAMGVKKMQSKDGTARVGGAVQTAGGVAGLVAMTNFWNPVGWAAAIPAALSIGGGLMGAGGGTDPLAGTPLGKYRRRVGIR